MNVRGFILVFESGGNKTIRADDAIYKIGTSLDHSLINQLLEGFRFADHAQVIQEHIPEPGINQVSGGVLGASQIKVHISPILVGLLADNGFVIVRVHIAEIIGGRAGESGHRIQFNRMPLLCFPILRPSHRRFAGFRRQILVDFRHFQRQFGFIQHIGHIVLVIHGERFAPIALTAENGVPQAVIDLAFADASCFDLLGYFGNRLFDLQAVQHTAVDHFSLFGVIRTFAQVDGMTVVDDRNNRQIKFSGEGIVPAIVCGNRHNGARSVAGKHIFADPYGDGFIRKGIHGVRAGEHAGHGLHLALAFPFRAFGDIFQVIRHRFLLFRGGQWFYVFAFRRQYHKTHSVYGIRTSGEYF